MYEKLFQITKDKNLTIRKLAILSKIAPPDLYNALNGKKPLYPGWKKRIAEVLEVNERDFDD